MTFLKNPDAAGFELIFDDIIDQKISTADIKKILLEINDNGFTTPIFVGAVSALKKRMRKINAPLNAIDVCGTGGDKLQTLNISTAVCFVAAASGLVIAKHGNKAISSNSGSADIFAQLKIKISDEILEIEKNLQQKKLCFLFAPFFHESLKNLAQLRKEIAQEFNTPTIFNYLGPLLNPANTKIQLIGTSKKETMQPMLEALKIQGLQRVYIVHGFDGMDEITLCDNSYIMRLENDKIFAEEIIDPTDLGFNKVDLAQLKGQDPQYNAQKLLMLLDGEKSAYRDIVILNAGFVLKLAGMADNVENGIKMAGELIDKGEAKKVLLSMQQG